MLPVPQSSKHAADAVDVARAILDGSLSVLEGARKMADIHLYSGHVRQPVDEDYALLLGIASETDHLPLGEVRNRWAAEALVKKDAETQEAEVFFRARAFKAARVLIARYENWA